MEASLAAIAARQGGVFTRAQARGAGYSDRQITQRARGGDWLRCVAGVYRIAGAPITPTMRMWAAILAAGEGAALSHVVAARLLRLDDGLPDLARVDVTVPTQRRPRTVPAGIVHRRALPPEHVVRRQGLPVTSTARTLIDLAGQLPVERSVRIASEALRLGMVEVDELDRVAASLRGCVGIERARETLSVIDPRLESGLEVELLDLAHRAGVQPVPQYEVFLDGRFVARLDLAVVHLRLGLEADGFGTHGRRSGFERDRERHAVVQLAGWTVLSFTATQIRKHRQWVIDVIARRVAQLEKDRERFRTAEVQ